MAVTRQCSQRFCPHRSAFSGTGCSCRSSKSIGSAVSASRPPSVVPTSVLRRTRGGEFEALVFSSCASPRSRGGVTRRPRLSLSPSPIASCTPANTRWPSRTTAPAAPSSPPPSLPCSSLPRQGSPPGAPAGLAGRSLAGAAGKQLK